MHLAALLRRPEDDELPGDLPPFPGFHAQSLYDDARRLFRYLHLFRWANSAGCQLAKAGDEVAATGGALRFEFRPDYGVGCLDTPPLRVAEWSIRVNLLSGLVELLPGPTWCESENPPPRIAGRFAECVTALGGVDPDADPAIGWLRPPDTGHLRSLWWDWRGESRDRQETPDRLNGIQAAIGHLLDPSEIRTRSGGCRVCGQPTTSRNASYCEEHRHIGRENQRRSVAAAMRKHWQDEKAQK